MTRKERMNADFLKRVEMFEEFAQSAFEEFAQSAFLVSG
jgi:hypothetical protein